MELYARISRTVKEGHFNKEEKGVRQLLTKRRQIWRDPLTRKFYLRIGRKIRLFLNGEFRIFTRRHDKEKGSWVKYQDIFAAFRGMLHILISYFGVDNLEQGEIKELEALAQRIEGKRKRLDSDLSKEAREKTEKEILEIALELEGKVNEFKVRAKKRIKRGAKRTDVFKRFNISAQLASLVGAIFDTYRRKGEIKSIVPHIWRRKHEIEREIDLLDRQFKECRGWIQGDLHNKKRISEKTCWAIIHTLKKVYAPPYREAAAEIILLLHQYLSIRWGEEQTTQLEKFFITLLEKKFREVAKFLELKKLKPE